MTGGAGTDFASRTYKRIRRMSAENTSVETLNILLQLYRGYAYRSRFELFQLSVLPFKVDTLPPRPFTSYSNGESSAVKH